MKPFLALLGRLLLALLLLSSLSAKPAAAFPFLELKPGDVLPPLRLSHFQSSAPLTLDKLRGSPVVLVFWDADLADKARRSLKVFQALQERLTFFSRRDIPIVAVYLGSDPSRISALQKALGVELPVYLDRRGEAADRLGIYVLPTVLLVDGQGKAVFGMGYSRTLVSRLEEQVELLRGEKTAAQLAAARQPAARPLSAAEKKAHRHLQAGMVMARQGFPEAALREFQASLRLAPKLAAALIEAGCLSVDLGRLDQAAGYLQQGLALEPDSLPGKLCQARLLAGQGRLDQALSQAWALSETFPDRHAVLATLADLLARKGNQRAAAQAFRKAYLQLKQSLRPAARSRSALPTDSPLAR